MSSDNNYATFPDEIWLDVLDYLSYRDLASCQRVSRQFMNIAADVMRQFRRLKISYSQSLTYPGNFEGRLSKYISRSHWDFSTRHFSNLLCLINRLLLNGILYRIDLKIERAETVEQLNQLHRILDPLFQTTAKLVIKLDRLSDITQAHFTEFLFTCFGQRQPCSTELHVTDNTSSFISHDALMLNISALKIKGLKYALSDRPWEILNSRAGYLRSLELASIHDLDQYVLTDFPWLESLTLYRTTGFPQLKLSSICDCKLFGAQGVKIDHLLPYLGQLKTLIMCNISVKAEDLLKYASEMKQMRVFQFQGGGWDFRWSLTQLAKALLAHCRQLRGLSLSVSCSDQSLMDIVAEAVKDRFGHLLLDLGLCQDHKELEAKLGRTFVDVIVKTEKYSGMTEANRILMKHKYKTFYLSLLNDLPSARERVWNRYLC